MVIRPSDETAPTDGGGPSDTVIVICGGEAPGLDPRNLPADALVIAADSGLDHAADLGLDVAIAVGDFDSVSARRLADAEASGTELRRHPVDKDATDLELALDAARATGARSVVVVGALGGRLDHELANLLLLASDRWADLSIELRDRRARMVVARGRRTLTGSVGDHVTLLAVGGRAVGVSITGVRWPLDDATLEPGSSLGVSNELDSPVAVLTVADGVVLAVQPQ